MLFLLGSSYQRVYRREVERRLATAPRNIVVAASDVTRLPVAVRRYLKVTGALGRSRVENFRVTLRGEIRRGTNAGFMPFEAEQYNFVRDPARLFLLKAKLAGIPFEAFHRYVGSSATMQVKVASLFTIADAHGPEMNQSETVTMFNDLCVLAPPTLIDPSIRWEELDPFNVKATFTNAGNTISAVLTFNETGELTNFESDDRYLSADGKTYEKYRWSTPVGDYRDFGGRRIAARGEASWRMPDGDFTYARAEFVSVEYNVGPK